jgi:hypothetical protein
MWGGYPRSGGRGGLTNHSWGVSPWVGNALIVRVADLDTVVNCRTRSRTEDAWGLPARTHDEPERWGSKRPPLVSSSARRESPDPLVRPGVAHPVMDVDAADCVEPPSQEQR